jgi:Collagen triple helix repeat (20 copies)
MGRIPNNDPNSPYDTWVRDEPRDGRSGSDGGVGATGPSGPAGPPGVDGVDGIDGVDGATGPAGAPGADGVDGVEGAPGPTGATGATGPAGSAAWTVAANWSFAVDGAVASVIADVTGMSEVVIECIEVGTTTVAQRCVQVSVDGGTTYFTASGDYQDISTEGTGANNVAFFLHATPVSAIRTCAMRLVRPSGARLGRVGEMITRALIQVFRGSTSAITHVRVVPIVSNVVSGNFNLGFITVLKR